jgi:hypothetical protein
MGPRGPFFYRPSCPQRRAFANIAKTGTSMVVPANVSDVASMIQTAMSVIKQVPDASKIPVRPTV